MSSKEEERLRRELDDLRDQYDNEVRKSSKLEKSKSRLEKQVEEGDKQTAEILELKKANRKLDSDSFDLKKKLERTLEESASLREEQLKNLKQVEQETEELRQKLRTSEKVNREIEKDKLRAETISVGLATELDKQSKLGARYKQSYEETLNDLSDAKAEIGRTKENEARLQEEVAEFRNKERITIDRITGLNTELAAKSTDHDKMKEEIDKKLQPLKFEIEEKKEEVDRLNSTIKSLQEEIEQLKAQQEKGIVAQMTRELAVQKEEMERAQRKYEREATENRFIYDQKVRGVEGDLNTLRSNQDVMTRMFNDERLEFDKKYLALQEEKKKIQIELDAIKKKTTQQEETNRKLQLENQKNQHEEIVIRDLKEQVRQLTYQLSATERFGNERSKSAAENLKQTAELVSSQKKHDEDSKKTNDQIKALTAEVTKLNEERQKRDKEMITLKTQSDNAQKRAEEIKKSNSQVLKDLNTKNKMLEAENRALKKAAGIPIIDSIASARGAALEAILQEADASSKRDSSDDSSSSQS